MVGLDPGSVANYAVDGATAGPDNENDMPGVAEFPGLQDEAQPMSLIDAAVQGSPHCLSIRFADTLDSNTAALESK